MARPNYRRAATEWSQVAEPVLVFDQLTVLASKTTNSRGETTRLVTPVKFPEGNSPVRIGIPLDHVDAFVAAVLAQRDAHLAETSAEAKAAATIDPVLAQAIADREAAGDITPSAAAQMRAALIRQPEADEPSA